MKRGTCKEKIEEKMIRQATKEALFLILISIGLAILVYAVRSDKVTLPTVAGIDDSATAVTPKSVGPSEITIEQAQRLFESDAALFADARNPIDFDAGHIRGAVNLYALEPDAWLPDFFVTTEPTTVIVTYCDGEDCHLAKDLAVILFNNGFDRVHHLKDGWGQWKSRGLPME